MANIRDIMTFEDALDVEQRFDTILREYNEYKERVGAGFREAERRAIFDWDFDLPESFFE